MTIKFWQQCQTSDLKWDLNPANSFEHHQNLPRRTNHITSTKGTLSCHWFHQPFVMVMSHSAARCTLTKKYILKLVLSAFYTHNTSNQKFVTQDYFHGKYNIVARIAIRLNINKILTDLRVLLLCVIPRGGLKPPMNTSISRCEVNQNPVTMPGLKQRLVAMFGPQNSLRSHLTASGI